VGVPAEIFINPAHVIRSYLATERVEGRLITAHMLATGVVVFGADPVVEQLRMESRDWLTRRIALSPEQTVRARYAAATKFEDGADVSATDGPTAVMLLTQAVAQMLEYWFHSRGEAVARSKDLLASIRARDLEAVEPRQRSFLRPPRGPTRRGGAHRRSCDRCSRDLPVGLWS
jgi:hypothetical protein